MIAEFFLNSVMIDVHSQGKRVTGTPWALATASVCNLVSAMIFAVFHAVTTRANSRLCGSPPVVKLKARSAAPSLTDASVSNMLTNVSRSTTSLTLRMEITLSWTVLLRSICSDAGSKETQKLNVSQVVTGFSEQSKWNSEAMTQDFGPSGHWIGSNVQMERRAPESEWNSECHFSSSLVDEVLVQEEFGSDSRSFDMAHDVPTISYESASGKDAPTYS